MIYLSIITLFASFSVNAIEIEQFIDLSYKNDPKIKEIINDREILKYYVDQSVENTETSLEIKSQTGYVSDQDTNNSNFEIGVTKDIATTGTNLSVSHSNFSASGEEGKTTSLKLEQSLLKNSFGSSTRLRINSLTLEQTTKELESVEQLETYLLSNLNKYLLFKKALIDFDLAKAQHLEAIKLQENLKKKYKSKIALLSDLNRGELLLLDRAQNLIEKKETKEQQELELLNVTGTKGKQLSSKAEFDFLLKKLKSLLKNKKSKVDQSKIRSFIIAKNNIEIAQKGITLSEDQSDASLELVAGYNKYDTTRFSTVTQQDETIIGLNYTIPFGDSQAKANTSVAKAQKLSKYYKKIKIKNDFETSLTKILNEITTLEKKLEISSKKITLSKSLIKEESKRYSIGQLSLEQLIDIKYTFYELEAKNLEIKTQYAYTMLNWLSMTDNLIGISF